MAIVSAVASMSDTQVRFLAKHNRLVIGCVGPIAKTHGSSVASVLLGCEQARRVAIKTVKQDLQCIKRIPNGGGYPIVTHFSEGPKMIILLGRHSRITTDHSSNASA